MDTKLRIHDIKVRLSTTTTRHRIGTSTSRGLNSGWDYTVFFKMAQICGISLGQNIPSPSQCWGKLLSIINLYICTFVI